jgi:hypothetical protein
MSCGAICGTRRMSNFLRRTPCAPLPAGHRTLPPIHQRGGRKAEAQGVRGSGRSEDPHREATCGVGPVTGSAGSESRLGRGGRHPASSARGPLGAHTIERPSPSFRSGIGPAASQDGDRVPAGLPEGARVPGHRRLRPEVSWIRTTAGLPEVGRARTARKVPHRGATRGVGPVTGTAGAGRCWTTRWASSPPQPEGLLVLIPPGDFQTSDQPPACRWAIGAGQERRSTPRGNSRRRPGDGDGGVGEQVRSRWASPLPPQSRGPSLMLIPSKRALTFCSCSTGTHSSRGR